MKDLANIVSEIREELISVVDALDVYNAGETAKVHAMGDGNIRVVFGCDWFGYIRYDGVVYHAKQMRHGGVYREQFNAIRDAVVWLVNKFFALDEKPAYKMEIADGVNVEAVKWALVDAGFKLVPINRGKGASKDAPKWRIEEFI